MGCVCVYLLCSTVEEEENNLKNIKEEEGHSTGILINWTGEKHTNTGDHTWCDTAHSSLKAHKGNSMSGQRVVRYDREEQINSHLFLMEQGQSVETSKASSVAAAFW